MPACSGGLQLLPLPLVKRGGEPPVLDGIGIQLAPITKMRISPWLWFRWSRSFANCLKSDFRKASLAETNLHHVSAANSDFSGAQMDSVNCTEGSFYKATFANIRMRGCDFKGALLYETDLTRTYLEIGNIITQQQLDKAMAEPGRPPFIADMFIDLDTGQQLNWHGETPLAVIRRRKREQQDKLAGPKPPGRSINLVEVSRINGKPPSKPQAGYF